VTPGLPTLREKEKKEKAKKAKTLWGPGVKKGGLKKKGMGEATMPPKRPGILEDNVEAVWR